MLSACEYRPQENTQPRSLTDSLEKLLGLLLCENQETCGALFCFVLSLNAGRKLVCVYVCVHVCTDMQALISLGFYYPKYVPVAKQ
jgi:hypothetical protein